MRAGSVKGARTFIRAAGAALALCCVMVLAVGLPMQVKVLTPRLGMPAIAQPGSVIQVRLAGSLPLILPDFELELEGRGGVSQLQVKGTQWRGFETLVTLTLPELPDGAYALRLKTRDQALVMPKAVFVRKNWSDPLRVAHIADLPAPGHEALMRQFIAQMQQRQPDAVLVSGDINYGGSQQNIDFMFAELARLDMPVILTAGNHEREGWHRYLRVFGARNHRTSLGPITVISLDSGHGRDALTPDAMRWLRRELVDAGGRTTLIQIHHPLFPPGSSANPEAGGTGGYLRGGRNEFLELCEQFRVTMVLGGRRNIKTEIDDTGASRSDGEDFPGTKYVVTTTLGADTRAVFAGQPPVSGYRWIVFTNGQLTSYAQITDNPLQGTATVAPAVQP